MAKKTAVMRVHQLAKELGVSSKDVVAKCQAEDMPDITNHMSAISVGLAVTVREWFGSASGSSTAVETAARVDLEKVRKKTTRKTKKKVTKKVAAESEVAESPSRHRPRRRLRRPSADDARGSLEPVSIAPVVEEPSSDEGSDDGSVPGESPAVAAEAPDHPGGSEPTPVMNVPERPDVVKPAGDQLTERRR